jgi:anti-anti-sigma regulatory factor
MANVSNRNHQTQVLWSDIDKFGSETSNERKYVTESTATPADTATAPVASSVSPLVVTCATSLDIAEVQLLYGQLQHLLTKRQPVVLDAAQVERADSAALQLLSAFVQEAQTRGMQVHWEQPSAALLDAVRLLDLGAYLALSGSATV